jgi:hypothetical protein
MYIDHFLFPLPIIDFVMEILQESGMGQELSRRDD